jgi:hypothetical protein
MTDTGTKRCSRCRRVKPLSEFHRSKHNRSGDGYRSACKECRWKLPQLIPDQSQEAIEAAADPVEDRRPPPGYRSSRVWSSPSPDQISPDPSSTPAPESESEPALTINYDDSDPPHLDGSSPGVIPIEEYDPTTGGYRTKGYTKFKSKWRTTYKRKAW